MVYDRHKEQLINEFNKLKRGQKIIVLGTGSLFYKMKNIFNLNVENDIELFVESSPKNKVFLGKQLVSIHSMTYHLKDEEEYVVLVCSSKWTDIKKILSKRYLNEFIWYAPYESMKWLFNKNELPIVKLKRSIYKLLLEFEGKLPRLKGESIVILIGERNGAPTPYHAITLGVLLKVKGLDVYFLLNDLSTFGELYSGKGFGDFQNEILENLLIEIRKKYRIPYEKISEQNSMELTASEERKIQQFIYYNKVWHSKKIIFDRDDKELMVRAKSWLSNAKLIKGFLNSYNFDKAYVWTGVHSEWASLRILAEEKGIKTYSSEYARKGYSFSLSGPTVFQKDSTLVNVNNLSENKVKQIMRKTDRHLEESIYGYSKTELKQPSAIIPLNIFWDSAAFNIDDIFIYFDKWLEKTIRFLIEECQTHVYVRQHPHERSHGTGEDVKKFLTNKFGDSKYFHYIDTESSISTYSLLMDATLLLPNTSTLGIEAAMLGKQVIVKNKVYYAKSNFVKVASTEQEYLNLVKQAIENPKELSLRQRNEAKLYYALTMANSTEKFFGHWYDDVKEWSSKSLEEIKNRESVMWLLDLIINDRTLLTNKLKH